LQAEQRLRYGGSVVDPPLSIPSFFKVAGLYPGNPNMTTSLRVLHLEDNPSDAELVLHTLRRAGFDPTVNRVETEPEFRYQLQLNPDVILADFTMPEFDSLHALEIMKAKQLEIPFIIVSGTIGEERAVQVMQNGATDYIIKDRLGRLGPAVSQALSRSRLKEEKLKAEHAVARLAAIVESSGDAIFASSLDGIATSWNRAAESVYGYSADEMILDKNISILYPTTRRQTDDPEDRAELMQRLRNGECIPPFETICLRKDGRRIEVLQSISPIRDRQGVVIGASSIATDITVRKRSERFLNVAQAVTVVLAECKSLDDAGPKLLQTIAGCLRWEVGVLWMIDRDANRLRLAHRWHSSWADARFVEALRHTTAIEAGAGVAGRTWSTGQTVWESGVFFDGRQSKDAPVSPDGLRCGFGFPMRRESEMVGVIEFFHPDLREPDQMLLDALDNIASQISQFCTRRRIEIALHASESQFRQLADAMPQIVWTARSDGTIDYLNERAYQFAECRPGSCTQDIWQSIVHRDDCAQTDEAWARSVANGTPFEVEVRLNARGPGGHRWYLLRAVAVSDVDGDGMLTRWYGTGTDIDDQKRNLEALRISEERFRTLIMKLPAAVYTTDAAGRITLFNDFAVELWGRRPELGTESWCGAWKLFEADGTPLPLDQCPMAKTVRDGRPIRGVETIVERPDGSRSTVLPHPEVLLGVNGETVGAVNMVIDLTQTKLLEDQIRQSQKMEAVGQLAAGVAHDFNNLLTVILGYSEILLSRLPSADPNRDHLAQIRKAGEGAAGLTRQLLAFGRKQIIAPTLLDCNALIHELEKLLKHLIGADVELVTQIQNRIGCVKADSGQVEQIIVNLVVNARDAMPTGGRITIRTADAIASEMQRRVNPDLAPGAYVLIEVADTGTGMDDATKKHIFEPFFTTKGVGKGTGLGLATVFGIVKQSSGFIEVESSVGAGSVFRIYLPQVSESTQPKDLIGGPAIVPCGGETILLVEDEQLLRDMTRMFLEAGGYTVLSASDGDDAIRVAHELGDKIHLLFTDVVMPKMSGRQLTEYLLPFHPHMKVLYMSGYTDDTIMRHGIQEESTNFLPKPFTHVALAQKIRAVLDRPSDHVELAASTDTAFACIEERPH